MYGINETALNSAHWLGNVGKRVGIPKLRLIGSKPWRFHRHAFPQTIPILLLLAEAIGVQVHFQEYEEARSLLEQITEEQRGAFSDTAGFAMLLLDDADPGAW